MTAFRLRYVQAWVNSEGRPHHYFRRPGYNRVPLPGMPGSLEFMQAYQAAVAQNAKPVGIKRSKPGSVAAAIASYLDSTLHFASRAAGTQAMQRAILERFREQCGDYPIALMPPKFIAALLAKKKPHAARNWLKAIRGLCQYAITQDLLKEDPTTGIKLPPAKSAGHHTWTEQELAQFEAHHAIGTKERLALALGIYTVQRRGDVLRMGRQHVRNGTMHITQGKTGASLIIPGTARTQDRTGCDTQQASDVSDNRSRASISASLLLAEIPDMVQGSRASRTDVPSMDCARPAAVGWQREGVAPTRSQHGADTRHCGRSSATQKPPTRNA